MLPHCSEIARTTKTPPTKAIAIPIAVEIFASRSRFSRTLLDLVAPRPGAEGGRSRSVRLPARA